MKRLEKIIDEALIKYAKEPKSCSCGCGTCDDAKPTKPISLNESIASKNILSEGLKYCIDNNKPLTEHVYRAGSKSYFDLWAEARALYSRKIINISYPEDLEILTETDLGEFGYYEGKKVPLDYIFEESTQEETIDINLEDMGSYKAIIASVGSKKVGTLRLKPYKDSYYVEQVLVPGEYQNLGIGKEMYRAANDELGPIYSDAQQTQQAKYLWQSLIKSGEAEYLKDEKRYKMLPPTDTTQALEENTDEVINILNNPRLSDDVKATLFKAYRDGKITVQSVRSIIDKILKENISNPTDTITMDVPLFIRALEYAKEDAKTDMDLHKVAEKAIELSSNGRTLSMNDYDRIVGIVKEVISEAKKAKKKTPELNKPKRGGAKKFYVYVRDPKTKNIKKVSFGGTTGLSVKINDPKARQAFAKRHKCGQGEEKTSPKWWSCRIPRFAKLLGLKSNFTGFW